VEVYRLLRRRFAGANPFDGEGSFLYGGRWSSAGVQVSYAAVNRSLAVLEYRAHIDPPLMPGDLVIASLDIPDDLRPAETPALPENWKTYPAPAELREIGDRFLREEQSALLFLPSVLVPEEQNVLINPKHPDFRRMVQRQLLSPFTYDSRLL
jgi:RES domain-containing protein